MGNPTEYRCGECGSKSVTRDALLKWQASAQDWYIFDILDTAYCEECEKEVKAMEHIPGEVRPYRVTVSKTETRKAQVIVLSNDDNIEHDASTALDTFDFSEANPAEETKYSFEY